MMQRDIVAKARNSYNSNVSDKCNYRFLSSAAHIRLSLRAENINYTIEFQPTKGDTHLNWVFKAHHV